MMKLGISIDDNGFVRAVPVQHQNRSQTGKHMCCSKEMFERETFHNRSQTKTVVCLQCNYSETISQEKLDDELTERYRRLAKNAA